MKNNLVNQDIKTDKSAFSIGNNSEPWLTIPSDGAPITFTGNADDAAKEFFDALIRERDGYITTLKAERDAQQKRADALAVENAALKASRETLAKNALETCNDVFSAGFRNASLQLGLMESTGNRDLYPNPIKALVDEAIRELTTPATSAALAAIEARGVEKFADMCSEKSGLATTADSCAGWKNCSVHASSFAIRLREAK